MFLLLLNVSIGIGIVSHLKCLVFCSEGHNLRIIFIALVAAGVYLVMKASFLFLFLSTLFLGLSSKDLSKNRTSLVCLLMKVLEYPLL